MALKKDLIEQANKLGLEVDPKLTNSEIEELIASSDITKKAPASDVAKAGKRSAKAIKETEEKIAKEEAKKAPKEAAPKLVAKPTRTKLERKGKSLRNSYSKIEKNKLYELKEAIKLAKDTSFTKFDSSVELHINLNVDPRHADQNIRDIVVLPAGSGKKIKVAVFTEDTKNALGYGADIAGTDNITADLDKGKIDFDILICSPNLMPKLSKYARILGPRGLMPNPKSGTVSADIEKAVKESKGGRVEYRVDSNGIIHLGVGKVSFKEEDLAANLEASIASIKSNKPSSIKSALIQSAYLSTSMGPSIKLDITKL